jgi:hypothetical protein
MVKTTVYLPEDLDVRLEAAARAAGVSKAELIRQGVSLVLAQAGHPRPSQPLPVFTSGRPLTPAAMDDAIYDHIKERAARR